MKKEIRKQEVEAVREQDLEQVNGGNQLPANILALLGGGSLDNNKVSAQGSDGALTLNTTTIQH